MKRGYAGETGRVALPRKPKPRRRKKPIQIDLFADVRKLPKHDLTERTVSR